MVSDSRLESTIDKILTKTETDIISSLQNSLKESQDTLKNSQKSLEQEFDNIIDEGKKEAEKIQKQIVGSSDLESRNKQLLLIEKAIDDVFQNALNKIKNAERDSNYAQLINSLLEESTKILGTSQVLVYTNSKDRETVQSSLKNFSGAEFSSDSIDCLGGVLVKSKDGSMTFDNTLDAKIERLKPLIRKEIASKFGIGS